MLTQEEKKILQTYFLSLQGPLFGQANAMGFKTTCIRRNRLCLRIIPKWKKKSLLTNLNIIPDLKTSGRGQHIVEDRVHAFSLLNPLPFDYFLFQADKTEPKGQSCPQKFVKSLSIKQNLKHKKFASNLFSLTTQHLSEQLIYFTPLT